MASSNIAGSWFPTGFYGHFRSKSRNDIHNEFRRLARPQPPSKFIAKSMMTPRKHLFSHHDNRHSFMTDALYFEEGLGRRRVQTAMVKSKPDLISWRYKPDPPYKYGETTYKNTYSYAGDYSPIILPQRPVTSYHDDRITTYRHAYGDNFKREISNDHIRCTTAQNRIRTIPITPPGRNDVAACLVWYKPPVTKCSSPPVTQTISFADTNPTNGNCPKVLISQGV